MLEFLHKFLGSELFIPHGHCYLWKPSLVWLHIVSDSLIALAYYSIPATLIYFVNKRRDVPFSGLFLLFGAFIISCGTTHVLEVWTLWHPTYWLSGFMKALTAAISVYTAVLLVTLIPQALELPSTAQLEAANAKMESEIAQRQIAEVALQKLNEELELRVSERTIQLKGAIEQLQDKIAERKQAESALRQSEAREREKSQQLEITLKELKQTQAQLIQTEKMSSLGQLVAGVAHEINNPVNFISGNLVHADKYTQDLLNLVHLYQQHYPQHLPEIQAEVEAIDLDFLTEDLPKLLSSMKVGTERIREIVLSLRNFSRLDEAEMKTVDIHEGIDSTLLILQNRLKAKPNHPDIHVIKEYGDLPKVECYAGQLNQVFMNILTNAIDALEMEMGKGKESSNYRSPTILIRTQVIDSFKVAIQIADNGSGMTEEVRSRLFDPFFTTKPVGKGTGLGMSISYQIVVEKHGGQLKCVSAPMQGAKFVIEIPIQPSKNKLLLV